jgi:hypothetical protein
MLEQNGMYVTGPTAMLKKANLAVTDNAVANVSEMKSSTTVEANCFTVSSPRMNETDEVGFLDTGCNVLCMQKE